MAGRYYDEWRIGDRLEHQPHRTVTETDNLLLCTLTHNPQPLHLDAEYAAGTEFGRIVVNGLFTFSLMVGLLHAETTVVEKRESKSRPNAGLVVFEHRMLNQRGEIVCQCRRTALMQRRAA